MKNKSAQQTKPKQQIYVGTYALGFINVELYALPGESGGSFYMRPDDKSPGRIKVGLNHREWPDVVNVLLHETFEMICSHMSLRYEKSGTFGDHSSYTFIFDHSQFCDICDRQAAFVTSALPDLCDAYKKHGAK